MRVHAFSTGRLTIKEAQRRGRGQGDLRLVNTLLDRAWTEPLPIYAWAIEHPEGLLLIDTGESARASQPGFLPWWNPFIRLTRKTAVSAEQEIGPQLTDAGLRPADVRWVILTHLHTDHTGGLGYFPQAECWVAGREWRDASGATGRLRGYLPQHWPGWFAPRPVDFAGPPIGPFPASHTLTRAGDVSLVPTPGHTGGHLSVIVRKAEAALFIAGDASYTEQLMLDRRVDGVAPNERQALQTLERIHQFITETPSVYLPSHDPQAAQRLEARTVVRPAG